jgi:hypothetical protein
MRPAFILYGVILNGLQAVKDLARVGRNVGPLNGPEEIPDLSRSAGFGRFSNRRSWQNPY